MFIPVIHFKGIDNFENAFFWKLKMIVVLFHTFKCSNDVFNPSLARGNKKVEDYECIILINRLIIKPLKFFFSPRVVCKLHESIKSSRLFSDTHPSHRTKQAPEIFTLIFGKN